MSVYSGFATRQQESFYNKLLERMVQLLSLKLLQSMKKIEDLLIVNSELQYKKDGIRESTAILKETTNFGCLNDSNLIKIEQLVDEK
jgi:hypothetical protein